MSKHQITIFRETAQALVDSLREAELDHLSFTQKIKVCDLNKCRATCCHDGVYLSQEEAAGVKSLAERVGKLDNMSLPDEPVIETGCGKHKTAVREAEDQLLADDYPEHFPRTRCVFLDSEHRCGLQRLAMKEGKPAWYYKPLTCWIHPILIRNRGWTERPLVTLPSSETDLQKSNGYPGFASCTHCGRRDEAGQFAYLALRAEFEMLESVSGRDFLQELIPVGRESENLND